MPASKQEKKPKKNRHQDAIAKTLESFGKDLPSTDVPAGPLIANTSRADTEARYVPVAEIQPDPTQPRKVDPDSEAMQDLMNSVRAHGVQTQILIRPNPSAEGYLIIAGERRWTAAREVGLETIPARILQVTDEQAAILQMVENLQREDLNPVEEARGLHKLAKATGLNQPQLAQELSKSKSYVSRMMAITTKFPDTILGELERVADPQLPKKSRIFEALAAPDEKTQREILFGGLTQAQAREAKKKATGNRGRPRNYSKKFSVPGATVTVTLKTSEVDDAAIQEALRTAWHATQESQK